MRHLRQHGISERCWPVIAKANGRLLVPLREFYSGNLATAALDHLQVISATGLTRQPPVWLLRQLMTTWGDTGNRYSTFFRQFEQEGPCWRHVMRLLARSH